MGVHEGEEVVMHPGQKGWLPLQVHREAQQKKYLALFQNMGLSVLEATHNEHGACNTVSTN